VLRVRVEAPRRPTETKEAVGTALRNLFPDLQIEFQEDRLTGTTENLERLSKQAAFVGVVNFAAGSPLGDILVEIEADDLGAVIDDVAESTVDRKG